MKAYCEGLDLVEAVLGPVETVESKFSLIPQRFF